MFRVATTTQYNAPIDGEWQRQVGLATVALILVGGPLLWFGYVTTAAIVATVALSGCAECANYGLVEGSDFLRAKGIHDFVVYLYEPVLLMMGVPALASVTAGVSVALTERRSRWARVVFAMAATIVLMLLAQFLIFGEAITWVSRVTD